MPAGSMTRRARTKKVLTNKQLTRRVRTLAKQEGSRAHTSAFLYSATLLSNGSADVNYFDDTPLLFGTLNLDRNVTHYYYDCHIKLSTVAATGTTVRLIYGFDNDYDGANLVASEIIAGGSDSSAPYVSGEVTSLKESKHPNRNENYRCTIVKDMIIALEPNVPKAFNVRLPLFGKKTKGSGGSNIPDFLPFMLALSDEGDSTISMGVNYYKNVESD